MSRKAVETTRNISNTSGAGSANQCTVQWWFQTSCKGNASLEAERSDWPLEADNYQLRAVIEVDPLTTTETAEELNADHSVVVLHLKQIGKVKKLDKWVPPELTANLKNCCFEVLSLLILPNNNVSFLDCDVR